ncbi:carbon-nitrogen hydrolase family protein [Ferrimonas sediminicola]|uniref:Carbon-nitrogen hydrolase family protein n=1 Tax=Ferrimonas sediminicola TaxID=2569538 RepID=A0A4V5NVN3_9GAMM|nr:carbon-nitrogen hydrolase family protein [Ferrimonas sediminicola]TKB51221.1 carbon-nitrogen hydrolase family protein [Ferrimonas sediminicola]
MQLYALQCRSGADPADNLRWLRRQLAPLAEVAGDKLVVLPECVVAFDGPKGQWQSLAEPMGQGPLQRGLAELAELSRCTLVAGTLPILAPDGRAYAATLVFGAQGQCLARYDKVHLFDVTVGDNTGHYRESDTTCPGERLQVVDTPMGRVGLAVCYDLRFPELFRELVARGADIIAVPAAFTRVTGAAHWAPLLQARAIENQVYLVAAGQVGTHDNGRETWGHSMILDPWGEVLANAGDGEGLIHAPFDRQRIQEVRQAMPCLNHIRLPL